MSVTPRDLALTDHGSVMETNQFATQSETSSWWEVRSLDPCGQWQTMSDHDTRQDALDARMPGDRVVRRRGQS